MSLRILIALVLLAVAVRPAFAADTVFPSGLRVGLTPIAGLAPSKSFPGFESEDKSVKVLVAELPAQAYRDISQAVSADASATGSAKAQSIETAAGPAYYSIESGKDGAATVRRYSMILSGGSFAGYVAVQIQDDAGKTYSEDAVRQMFATATIRKEVPVGEQLDTLPFRLNDLASFKNVRTLAPGAAVILADGDEVTGFEPSPFMIIGLIGSTPAAADERERFARDTATSIPGVRDARITMSEPIRIGGMPAYETRIDATSGKDNTAVTIVQWLRFGGGTALRIVGSSPRDQWTTAFPRFRTVRDSIVPKS